MPLSERAQGIRVIIERDLPSRRAFASASFEEKLDFLDRLRDAELRYWHARAEEDMKSESE